MSENTLKEILEFGGDISIKASAGTGKTYTLTSKYLEELTRKSDGKFVKVGQLAAITFTEKAAAEMRERLRDILTKEIEKRGGDVKLEGSSANMNDDLDGVKEEAKLLAHLIRQRQALQTAYISTIHSFCARLLKENPLIANVDPAFTVIDEWESADLLERTTRKVALNRLRAGDKGTERLTLMMNFTSRGENFQGLVETLMKMIPLARSANKKPQDIVNDYKKNVDSLAAQSEGAAQRLLNHIPAMLDDGDKRSVERKIGTELGTLISVDPAERVLSIQPAIAVMELAKKLDKAIKDNEKRSANPRPRDVGKEAVRLMRLVAGPVLEKEIVKDVEALVSLVSAVKNEYNLAKEKLSALDFDDLEEKALELLRRGGDPVKRRFARFHRVLVDEFQDVNELQREIITALSRPEGLLIVGDMKQSIYGFRGTDFTVFKSQSEKIIETGGREFRLRENRRSAPSVINFTNGFFEQLMPMSAQNGDRLRFDREADGLLAVRAEAGVGEIIRLTVESKANSAEVRMMEAAALAELMQEMVDGGSKVAGKNGELRNVRYGDFALLLRKFTNVSIYENAFRHADIPYQVVKGKGFHDTQEVMDISSLLSFIDNPSDNLSLLSVLRSPLGGLSDVTLYSLSRDEKGGKRDPAKIILGVAPIPSEITGDEKEKIGIFIARAARWVSGGRRLSISELIETALTETGYQAVMMGRFQGEQKVANLQKLMDMSRTFEKHHGASLSGFIAAISKKREKGSGDAEASVIEAETKSVSIMTIHQSKGLEFPIVIVGDLGGGSGKRPSDNAIFHQRHGLAMKYYEEAGGKWFAGPLCLEMAERIKEAETEEEKRLLYVAMTRARDKLVLSGPGKAKNGSFGKWVDDCISAGNLETANKVVSQFPPAKEEKPEADAVKMVEEFTDALKRRAAPSLNPAPRRPFINMTVTALAEFKKCPRLYYYRNVMDLPMVSRERAFDREYDDGSSAVEFGSRVHSALEKINFEDIPDTSRFRKFVDEELADFPKARRDTVARNISAAFKNPPLSELVTGSAFHVRREAQIAVRLSADDIALFAQGKADIFWIGADGLRLVDYKTSNKPEDDSESVFQLSLYSLAIMSAYGNEALDACVVYLGGSKSEHTKITLTAGDLPTMKETALNLARELSRLASKPERNWPAKTGRHCDAGRCFFKGRCSGLKS